MSRVKLVEVSQAGGEVTDHYASLERSRGGRVPNMFKALGYNAAILGPAVEVADFVGGPSRLPAKEKQLAYLAASRVNNCEYCLERHSAAALKQGLNEHQIEAIHREGDLASDEAFDNREKAIIRFAEELTRTATAQSTVFEMLHEYFSDEEIVELTYVIASANMFNRIASGLGIELEPEFKK